MCGTITGPSTEDKGAIILGRYELREILGTKKNAVMWRACDRQLSTSVTVKLLDPGLSEVHEAHARLRAEAKLLARLRNEHVPAVLERGVISDGRACIVMEMLEGESLDSRLARRGTIDPERAVAIALHICVALAELHGLGAVHRDIKPDNVFSSTLFDGTRIAKVVDFGITWQPGDDPPPMMVGTPQYMAPECLANDHVPDPREDLWALGAVLYEALLGVPPYDAPTVAGVLTRLRHGTHAPATDVAELPDGLGAIIDMCLARDVDARFQNVTALARALAAYAAPSDRRLVARVERVASRARSRRRVENRATKPRSPRAAGVNREPRLSSPRRRRSFRRRAIASVAAALMFTGALIASAGAVSVVWGRTLTVEHDAPPPAPPAMLELGIDSQRPLQPYVARALAPPPVGTPLGSERLAPPAAADARAPRLPLPSRRTCSPSRPRSRSCVIPTRPSTRRLQRRSPPSSSRLTTTQTSTTCSEQPQRESADGCDGSMRQSAKR